MALLVDVGLEVGTGRGQTGRVCADEFRGDVLLDDERVLLGRGQLEAEGLRTAQQREREGVVGPVPQIDRTVFWLTTGYDASLRDRGRGMGRGRTPASRRGSSDPRP